VIDVSPATGADRPVLERLWQLFRHDMSEFTGDLPDAQGCYRSERLEAAFTDPGWMPYLVALDGAPVGFAVVRGLDRDQRVLNSYFVVRGARGRGTGTAAAARVLRRHPGAWSVAFQDTNASAVRLWRRVATEVADADWTEEHRAVPGRPDLPPDTWISLRA
jgi:predicted acetyltransferase